MSHRVLRAGASTTLSLAVMVVLAYGFGLMSHTEWVWWLAPLTVTLQAPLFRSHTGSTLALSGLTVVPDPAPAIDLVSSVVAAAITAWAVYTGNRLALIVGATFALLGRALERGDEPST